MCNQKCDSSVVTGCEWAARGFALVVIALGLVVLVGWTLDITALKSVLPGWVTMKANTALGFLMAGASLFAATRQQPTLAWHRTQLVLAAGVALLGLLTLSEYAFNVNLGIDQLLFTAPDEAVSKAPPGRMALITAAAFALSGVALLLLDRTWARIAAQTAALLSNLVGMLSILGYAYGATALYGGGGVYSSVALHTAIGLVLLNLGMLLARPQAGLMAVVTNTTLGGVMARRLLPFALLAPFLVGWFHLESEKRELFSSGFGDALVALTYITLFTALIWRTATTLRASDEELQKSELRHRTLVEWSPESVSVHRKGKFLYVNAAAIRMFAARSAHDLLGKPLLELMHPESLPLMLEQMKTHLNQGESVPMIEVQFIRFDGAVIDVEIQGTAIMYNGQPAIHGSMRDVTERKQAQAAQRWAALLFANIQDGAVVTDSDGAVQAINPAFTAITGYGEAEILGKNMRRLQSGRQGRDFYMQMWQSIKTTSGWQGELWNRRKNGDIYLQRLTIHAVLDPQGEVANYVSTLADLTPRQRAGQMEHLAHHDALTGLPNRLQLMSRLEHALGVSKRQNSLGAVLYFDLDHFKAVNDTWGHPAGDELLQQVALRIGGRMRDMDTLARLGGDEFVVVLEIVDKPEGAAAVAADIVRLLGQPFTLAQGQQANIGGSVGIAIFPADSDSVDTLLRHADVALYRAKSEGRNSFRFHEAA
ncbi:MAG: diguanylate cyclase [Pseudomonadota bacterium]